jgi:hypothetical protein
MQLPIRRVTLTDVANAKEAIRTYLSRVEGNVNFNDLAHLQIHLGTLVRFGLQERYDILKTESHILRIGTIAVATNPFELFLDYGNQIRARSKSTFPQFR